eukprot:3981366-Pyramimonas_sp.AAC.1
MKRCLQLPKPLPLDKPIGPIPAPKDGTYSGGLFAGSNAEESEDSLSTIYGLLCEHMEDELRDVLGIVGPEKKRLHWKGPWLSYCRQTDPGVRIRN